tara:strand:- start:378 stop:596 length:219 start_codon:yes stop_codon:yes gene_type:complete
VHDGIHVEKAGTPSVTICTDVFRVTSESMAAMWGAEGYNIVYTSHPISELNRSELRARCEEMFPEIASILLS